MEKKLRKFKSSPQLFLENDVFYGQRQGTVTYNIMQASQILMDASHTIDLQTVVLEKVLSTVLSIIKLMIKRNYRFDRSINNKFRRNRRY